MQIGARSDALRGKNCNRYTFHVDIPNTVMVNAVGKALVRDNMVKDKKFYTLTADYIFGHDLARAAKTFFDANGGKLIGDELVATDVTDFSPYLLKIRQAKPDVVCSNLAGNQVTNLIKQYAEFGLPYPIVGFNLNTADAWAAGDGNLERHLADGLVSHARRSGLEDLRRQLHQEERQAAGEPRLDRICLAEDDGAGHERDQVDRHRQADRLFREANAVRHPEGAQGLFPIWDHQLMQEAYPFTVKPKGQAKDKWDMLDARRGGSRGRTSRWKSSRRPRSRTPARCNRAGRRRADPGAPVTRISAAPTPASRRDRECSSSSCWNRWSMASCSAAIIC